MSLDGYDLDEAYEIDGPEDARRMYGAWAATYDDSFGRAWGYIAPREIAAILSGMAGPSDEILDIGAGTGLVAEHLRGRVVDALDITPEMLEVARGKGLYRQLVQGDLTARLDIADGSYDAVISCGTFTHGHVGPGALPHLLAATRPGGVVALSINAGIWDRLGFGAAFAALPGIHGLDRAEVAIYGQAAQSRDPAHAADRALIVTFRKA